MSWTRSDARHCSTTERRFLCAKPRWSPSTMKPWRLHGRLLRNDTQAMCPKTKLPVGHSKSFWKGLT